MKKPEMEELQQTLTTRSEPTPRKNLEISLWNSVEHVEGNHTQRVSVEAKSYESPVARETLWVRRKPLKRSYHKIWNRESRTDNSNFLREVTPHFGNEQHKPKRVKLPCSSSFSYKSRPKKLAKSMSWNDFGGFDSHMNLSFFHDELKLQELCDCGDIHNERQQRIVKKWKQQSGTNMLEWKERRVSHLSNLGWKIKKWVKMLSSRGKYVLDFKE